MRRSAERCARADDVATEVVRSVDGYSWSDGADPSPAVLEEIATVPRLATQLVGRWLATGEAATEAEHEQLSGPALLINAIDLPSLVKPYLLWREAAIGVLEQEGARLGCGESLLADARQMIARSCDASIVRMVRQFELERSRLQDALAEERAKLTHQALHDYLTGLPNRPLLFNRIAHALHGADRYGGTVALLFVDLDGFKAVNDSFGHETGDRLLVQVAGRLRTAVRPSDTVARLGGDEFIVLCDRLEDDSEADGAAVADRILAVLRLPFSLDVRGDEQLPTATTRTKRLVLRVSTGCEPDCPNTRSSVSCRRYVVSASRRSDVPAQHQLQAPAHQSRRCGRVAARLDKHDPQLDQG